MRTPMPLHLPNLRSFHPKCGVRLCALAAIAAGTVLAAQTPAPARQAAPATPHQPAHSHKRASTAHRAAKVAPPAPVTPPAPPPPNWPALAHAAPATVTWDSHGLRIQAENSSLQQILADVATATGAKVEGMGADQRVFGAYGPGQARDVLSQLLQGSGYNVLLAGDLGEGAPREIVLSQRHAGNASHGTNAAPQQNGDEEQGGDNDVEEEPPPPPPPPPAMNNQGFGPGGPVRTPQQVMEEMQRRQMLQQQQQQQQQETPGSIPPNPNQQ